MKWFFSRPHLTFNPSQNVYLFLGLVLSSSVVVALPRTIYERSFDFLWRSFIERDVYYHGSPPSPRALFTDELAVLQLVDPQHTWTR